MNTTIGSNGKKKLNVFNLPSPTRSMGDALPSSSMDSNVSLRRKQQKSQELGHAPWFVTFQGGQRGMLELRDGIRKNDKHLFIHTDLHKTKQQVGQCITGAPLVLGRAMSRLELIRLTMTRTWRKPPLSPLQYTLCLSTRPTSK